uniref:Reverse transcriptase n=1 Tax=Nicotiana tabacum TaxID=4097 RepID=A0A1S4BNA7_TOBAC|nr:PREDICTED: uncharacterized protein LOC107810121 [Nicotiana tabacum]
MECKFSNGTQEGDMEVRLDTQVITNRGSFKYLGSIIQGKFYKVVVRPTMLYGVECWPVKNSHTKKLKVAEMRILRWMCRPTRLDNIRNKVIREKVGVAHVEDKIWEARLRWFGHVNRRSIEASVRRCKRLASMGNSRGRGRPKKSWGEVIRRDMA